MDIGTAFLLGVLVGQWVLLFVIWRVLNKLVDLISDAGTKPIIPPSRVQHNPHVFPPIRI